MNEYKKRILQARNEFINLNFEQEKELFKIYNDSGNKLIDKILNMTDSRTKTHNIETYKIINEYRTELYNNLNKTIANNITKSSDIQKGVQLSFVDMIAPDVKINEALKRTITKVSNDTVKQLIAGEYYKDGKTLSKRIWNFTGDNGNKIDAIIKENIAKGANVRELAKELEKYVNPKNRITPKTFADGIGGDSISYQARRLARTSITHAQTETMIQNAKKNPFCLGLKWNLSASHSARMHGKADVCDDYNGKTFRPEEVPLQHANCLCYFTEVIEDLDKCIETMNDYKNGKKNTDIGEWISSGDDKASIKITTPNEIQTKINIKNIELNNDKSDIIKQKEFVPAKNIKEANEYTKNTLGINAEYKGLDIRCANEWNKCLTKTFEKFPELKQNFGFVGESHERNKLAKDIYINNKFEELRNNIKNIGFTDEQLMDYAKKKATEFVRKTLAVGKNEIASSWSPSGDYASCRGICINKEIGKDFDSFVASKIRQVETKWKPKGTGSIKGTFDHEFGHQLDDWLKVREQPNIKEIFNSRTKQQITDELSEYSWNNSNPNKYSEMIAEGWTEYCNSSEPRPMAKEIGETIERLYVEWKKENS